MPEYRRAFAPGSVFFFTVVTCDRHPVLTAPHSIPLLREAFRRTLARFPFDINAIVIMPNHIHTVWTLPDGDADFSSRWRLLKTLFARAYLKAGGQEANRVASRVARDERGVWQRRFWERVVRDEDEYAHYLDYIHYNPVSHGLVSCPHAWPHSSFQLWVRRRIYDADWACECRHRVPPPNFGHIEDLTGE